MKKSVEKHFGFSFFSDVSDRIFSQSKYNLIKDDLNVVKKIHFLENPIRNVVKKFPSNTFLESQSPTLPH